MTQAAGNENVDLSSKSKLPNAVLDAHVLLGYASQKGLDVEIRADSMRLPTMLSATQRRKTSSKSR